MSDKRPRQSMKRFKLIFNIVFFLYHLTILVFVYIIHRNADDIGFMLKLHDNISLLFYGAIIGLILFITGIALNYFDKLKLERSVERLEKDNTKLKAKLYDAAEYQKDEEKRVKAEQQKDAIEETTDTKDQKEG